jgi:hypothetical protein
VANRRDSQTQARLAAVLCLVSCGSNPATPTEQPRVEVPASPVLHSQKRTGGRLEHQRIRVLACELGREIVNQVALPSPRYLAQPTETVQQMFDSLPEPMVEPPRIVW